MLKTSRTAAFILPLALTIGASILLLGTFLIEQALFSREMQSHRDRHAQAGNIIRWHVPQLIGNLENILNAPHATTALRKNHARENTYSMIVANHSKEGRHEWKDLAPANPGTRFKSAVADFHYTGNDVNLSPAGAQSRIILSWAFEDIGLVESHRPPPEWWPWPSWLASGITEPGPVHDSFESITGKQWNPDSWVPDGSPIPFNPVAYPANVPVITHIDLRFGIFATGPVDKPRKVVRIRFYIDCGIWNPYNRPMRFHESSGKDPAFMVLFRNMPSIRIQNVSTGISTEWIPLDDCKNTQTGESGIHAWVRTSRTIGAGSVRVLSEPDPQLQPEGLARTIHPAFLMGPADEIRIEFKQPESGVTVTCSPIDGASPGQAPTEWFHANSLNGSFPTIHFTRADDPNRPFYIESGSLSFRPSNTHQQILLGRPAESLHGLSDPRRQHLRPEDPRIDATGEKMPYKSLLNTQISNLRHSPIHQYQPPPAISILSWPGREPSSLTEATDLPEWENAFLLGTTGASKVNDFFMTKWPNVYHSIRREIPNEGEFDFAAAVPVNSLSRKAWLNALGMDTDKLAFGYPKYANPQNASDYWAPDRSALNSAIHRLVTQIEKDPSVSVPDFFTRGKLIHAFDEIYGEDPLVRFAPIRGFLRTSPPLVPHGSAWVLHMAVSIQADGISIKKSARVWLLKNPNKTGSDTLKLIHFEWTEPEKSAEWMIN